MVKYNIQVIYTSPTFMTDLDIINEKKKSFVHFGYSWWNINKASSSWNHYMQDENKIRRNLSDFAFEGGIEERGIEIPGTGGLFRISLISKSIDDIAY